MLSHRFWPKLAPFFPVRDNVDTRIVSEVKERKGAIIDSQSEVGGWPVYEGGEAPIDTDKDGMPDALETEKGLNPNDASDRNGDLDEDGYTNIEAYINGLVEYDTSTSIHQKPNNTELFSCQFFTLSKKLYVNLNLITKKGLKHRGNKSGRKAFPRWFTEKQFPSGISTLELDMTPFITDRIILLKVSAENNISLQKSCPILTYLFIFLRFSFQEDLNLLKKAISMR